MFPVALSVAVLVPACPSNAFSSALNPSAYLALSAGVFKARGAVAAAPPMPEPDAERDAEDVLDAVAACNADDSRPYKATFAPPTFVLSGAVPPMPEPDVERDGEVVFDAVAVAAAACNADERRPYSAAFAPPEFVPSAAVPAPSAAAEVAEATAAGRALGRLKRASRDWA